MYLPVTRIVNYYYTDYVRIARLNKGQPAERIVKSCTREVTKLKLS